MVRQSPRHAPGTPPSLNTLMPISPFGSHPRVSSSPRHPLSYPDVPGWPCTAPPSSGSPTVFLSPATDGKYGALLSPYPCGVCLKSCAIGQLDLSTLRPVPPSRGAAPPPCGISLEPKPLATGPQYDLSFLSPRGRRAEGGEEGEGGEGRSGGGGVYRKRHKGRIRFLEQTLLPVDPGGRWGNTLGVMEAK